MRAWLACAARKVCLGPLLLALLAAWPGCETVRPPAALPCPDHPAQAGGERYYALVFSAQSTPKLPRFTHTWVTLVRVGTDQDGRPGAPQAQTISWLPVAIDIRPLDLLVEPGVNLDLHASLREALKRCERVSLWGPYEVRAELYRHFVARKCELETGRVGYQVVDVVGEAALGGGVNCIHAVTQADPAFGRGPVLEFGDDAGSAIAASLIERGAVVCPAQAHDWLIPALGLAQCPIVRRTPRVAAGP